jgi:hypothetical protein
VDRKIFTRLNSEKISKLPQMPQRLQATSNQEVIDLKMQEEITKAVNTGDLVRAYQLDDALQALKKQKLADYIKATDATKAAKNKATTATKNIAESVATGGEYAGKNADELSELSRQLEKSGDIQGALKVERAAKEAAMEATEAAMKKTESIVNRLGVSGGQVGEFIEKYWTRRIPDTLANNIALEAAKEGSTQAVQSVADTEINGNEGEKQKDRSKLEQEVKSNFKYESKSEK